VHRQSLDAGTLFLLATDSAVMQQTLLLMKLHLFGVLPVAVSVSSQARPQRCKLSWRPVFCPQQQRQQQTQEAAQRGHAGHCDSRCCASQQATAAAAAAEEQRRGSWE